MMRDYSNYHTNRNDKIKHDGELLFEYALSGYEAEDVTIDGLNTKAIIHTKYSNNVYGEVRYILGRQNEIKRGSVVDWNNQTWLITTLPEDNKIYKKSELKLCNYKLKFQQNNIIHEVPCIAYNSSLTTDGTNEDKYMRLPKGQIGILISVNELTNPFKRDNRFFIHENVWRIDYIDRLQDGLLDITLVSDQIDVTKDNVELGIADYVVVTETPTTPSTGFTCEIIGDSSIVNNQTKTYTVKWLDNGAEIIDTILSVNLSNTSLATFTFTGNTITLTADRINKGMLTIAVTSTTNGIVGTKDIQIKGLW